MLSLVKFCDPCWDTYHAPKIKITYTPHIYAASTLEVRRNMPFIFHIDHAPCSNRNSLSSMLLVKWDIDYAKLWKKYRGTWRSQVLEKNDDDEQIKAHRKRKKNKDSYVSKLQVRKERSYKGVLIIRHVSTHLHILI